MYLCFLVLIVRMSHVHENDHRLRLLLDQKIQQVNAFSMRIRFGISIDDIGTQYAGRVVQQYSPKGKIALEIIKDLHLYIGELLREFSHHSSRLPNKLVFYRAGVDDGAFQKVLDNEVRAIQRACQGLIHSSSSRSHNL